MANKNLFRVVLPDGTEHLVTPTLEDTLAFETTLRKNKNWGSLQDSALKLHPFRCWNALRRKGLTELTWDEFTTGDTAAISVETVDDEDDEDNLAIAAVGKGGKTGASTSSSSASPSAPASPLTSGDDKKPTT